MSMQGGKTMSARGGLGDGLRMVAHKCAHTKHNVGGDGDGDNNYATPRAQHEALYMIKV